MRASVWTCAFAHVLTLHSLRSLHFASSSAHVCLRSTLLFSLCVQMEDRRVPTSHVKGSSRDGSKARSRVSRHRSSAPGWYLCRVFRSLSGRPWLASQLSRACRVVSGVPPAGVSHSRQLGLVQAMGRILCNCTLVGTIPHRIFSDIDVNSGPRPFDLTSFQVFFQSVVG